MVKKKVDARVRTLIENGVAARHRSMFVLVGDKGRDQVVNLHYMLSKATVRARPSVLWCYKKELGFTTSVKLGHVIWQSQCMLNSGPRCMATPMHVEFEPCSIVLPLLPSLSHHKLLWA